MPDPATDPATEPALAPSAPLAPPPPLPVAPSVPRRVLRASVRRWLSRAAWLLPLFAFALQARTALAPPTPPPIPAPSGDARFGLAEAERHAVFTEIMRPTPGLRRQAQKDIPHHAWTREDHYYNMLRGHVAAVARAHGVTYTQGYLVFDEGVRGRWPGPDGQPHAATTLPLVMARTPDP